LQSSDLGGIIPSPSFDLSFDADQVYVVYDGHELLACRDAAAAIAAGAGQAFGDNTPGTISVANAMLLR
jgi:hypothetical protein